jgi:hypothetical protein
MVSRISGWPWKSLKMTHWTTNILIQIPDITEIEQELI